MGDKKEDGIAFLNNMVALLKEDTHYISIKEWKEKRIYRYENGIFIRDGDTYIKGFLRQFDQSIMPETMNTITNLLMAETYDSYKNLDKDINHIVTNNKVINIITGEVKEFSPEFKSTFRIPVTYDPNAKCPKFDKFLTELVHLEDIPVIEEMIGYCLYKTNVYKQIFYLFGGNDSGKSTYLLVLKTFLGGNEVVSAETIQHLGNPMFQYSVASLFGKLANLCGESPTTEIKETSLLKSLSSHGDLIEGNEKFGNKLRFESFAKLIFASHHMVVFPEEETEEMMSRMKFIICPFTRNKDQQDPTLINKLTSPEELSGILNMGLRGLKRLILNNGKMSNYKTKEENLEIYNNSGSSIRKFINEKIERSAIGFITQLDLYNGYEEFCKKNKLPTLSNKKFFMEFKLIIGFNEDMKLFPRINGQSVRAIGGIIWKLDNPDFEIVSKNNSINVTKKDEIVNLAENKIVKVANDDADDADDDTLLYGKNKVSFPPLKDICVSASSASSEELEDLQIPPWIEQGISEEEYVYYQNLYEETENLEEERVAKDLEEIASKMFPQPYPEPEDIQEFKICEKCGKENVSPFSGLLICSDCEKEISDRNKKQKTEQPKYPCKGCGQMFYENYLGFDQGTYNIETDGICIDCRMKPK